MPESRFSFFVMDFILLLIFLSLINTVFEFHNSFFFAELVLILLLGFFAIISMIAVYNGTNWGWKLLFFIMGIVLANQLIIYYFTGRQAYFLLVTILALIGFLTSAAKIKKPEDENYDADDFEEPVKTEFKPGKYVASKTGKKYHIAKCDWAKKIKKSNQVWFDSEEEAKEKGYKADTCLN